MKNESYSLFLNVRISIQAARAGAPAPSARRPTLVPHHDAFVLAESFVADFDGRSSLLYRFNQKSTSTLKDVISLRFKSHQAEGVLVHGEGQRGDYITLELHRGRLDLYLNLGAFEPSL